MSAADILKLVREAQPYALQGGAVVAPLRAVGLLEFLGLKIPPREFILSPWMHTQSLTMIYAWRGVGKTHLSIGIAYAVASGGKFLNWEVYRPRRVLFLDGEMPAASLQERFAATAAASAAEPPDKFLHIVTPDLQADAMPDLATQAGQEKLDALIAETDAELIIIDNLSAWMRGGGRENDSESWLPVQGWALRHRKAGRSILFIHHAGKGGAQRGTSKKEDILDCVIRLQRPADYEPTQGAAFEVHYDKARGVHGENASAFEARLATDAHGHQLWTTRTLEESTYDRVIDLANAGLAQKEIAEELQIDKSRVSRHMKRAREAGLITEDGGNNGFAR